MTRYIKAILASALLSLTLLAGTTIPAAATGSGHTPVTACMNAGIYDYGVRLWFDENQSGNSRTACFSRFGNVVDPHLGYNENPDGDPLYNIWNGNQRVDSGTVILRDGCRVTLTLYYGTFWNGGVLQSNTWTNNTGGWETYAFNVIADDQASSLEMWGTANTTCELV